MAQKVFLVHIDMNKNQIQNGVFQNLTVAPSTPSVGQFYFDTVLGYPRMWNGSSWENMADTGGGGGAAQLTELSDVDSATQTAGFVLISDGANYFGRALTETDISDLGTTAVLKSLASTAALSFVVDEDNMSSDSNTKVPTQQSVKAYVDSAIAGLTALEAEDIDTLGEINAILGVGTTLIRQEDTSVAGWAMVADEDDMISDSDIKIPTQQSVKKYVDDSVMGKFSTTVSASANQVITHNLNSRDVVVSVYRTASPYDEILCLVEKDTVNAISLTFNVAPTAGEYTVSVIG